MSFSQPQTSSFPSENALLETFSGRGLQRSQDNALLMQQHQQQIGATDTDYISRAAQGLLTIGAPGEAGEAERAAAYPGVVAQLQRNGLARNAPAQYPGYKALQGYANMGMSVQQQYQMGLGPTPPGLAEALKGVYSPTTGAGGPGPGAVRRSGPGVPGDPASPGVRDRPPPGRRGRPTRPGTGLGAGLLRRLRRRREQVRWDGLCCPSGPDVSAYQGRERECPACHQCLRRNHCPAH